MNAPDRFELVFEKLRAAISEQAARPETAVEILWAPEITEAELDEINELRQIILEVGDPEPMSFTTT
jgi:hypothetical protein